MICCAFQKEKISTTYGLKKPSEKISSLVLYSDLNLKKKITQHSVRMFLDINNYK